MCQVRLDDFGSLLFRSHRHRILLPFHHELESPQPLGAGAEPATYRRSLIVADESKAFGEV